MAVIVPFLEEGLDAAQPTIVVMNERVSALLAAAVGHPDLIFLDPRERRHDPASAIRGKQELMAKHVAGGAQRIRVVGRRTPASALRGSGGPATKRPSIICTPDFPSGASVPTTGASHPPL